MTASQTAPTAARPRAELILWILPVIASVVLPGLVWAVLARPMAVRFHLFAVMSSIVAFLSMLILAIYSRGFRHRIRWALSLTAITMLVLFQWPILSSAGAGAAEAVRMPILEDLLPVAAAAGFLWLTTRIGDERGFAVIINVGLLLAVAAMVIGLRPYAATPTAHSSVAIASPDSPDVLLVVLDGYPRADVLADAFNYDNSRFIAELEARDFFVADEARANYSFTYAAVSTMLEMDYVFDLGPVDPNEDMVMRRALSGSSSLVDQFRSQGYRVHFFENAWEGSSCGPPIDQCIRDGLIENAIWNLGRATILAPLVELVAPHPFTSVSLGHLEGLGESVTAPSQDAPLLTIAHLLLPHTPLLLDAECNIQNDSNRRVPIAGVEDKPGHMRDYFRDQVTCVNDLLLEQLDLILANSADTIVMITGDHGSSPTTDPAEPLEGQNPIEITERMSILSAYRMPDCEGFTYPQITPVNGVRAVTACALEQEMQPLPDLSRWISLGGKRTVTSLDGRLP